MAKANENGIVNRIFNVDMLRTRKDIQNVLDLIHGELTERMVNITIICHMDCARRILNEVTIYLIDMDFKH